MTAKPSARLRLPLAMRMRERRQFADLKAHGRRVVCGCLVANWLDLSPGARPQVGVITSRKLGGAVIRSRARRLLRESFRLHQHDLIQPVAMILVARASIRNKSRALVERDYLSALRRAHLLKAPL